MQALVAGLPMIRYGVPMQLLRGTPLSVAGPFLVDVPRGCDACGTAR